MQELDQFGGPGGGGPLSSEMSHIKQEPRSVPSQPDLKDNLDVKSVKRENEEDSNQEGAGTGKNMGNSVKAEAKEEDGKMKY